MSVRIYIEGGGNHNKALKIKCQQGFNAFFRKAGFTGRMPKPVPCGARNAAFGRFRTSVGINASDVMPMLLVDSEGPLADGHDPWQHLKSRDNWDRPEGTSDEQAQLMVQCMESWFLGDRDAVAEYYGNDFNRNALPANPRPEQIDKKAVLDSLKNASRNTTKGGDSKGRHSFEILAAIDPTAVRAVCPYADRLLMTLDHMSE